MNNVQIAMENRGVDANDKVEAKTAAEQIRIPKRHVKAIHTSFMSRVSVFAFSAFVIFLLYSGWENRDESYLTAESGWGYALGIIGGVTMFLLLLYPARKKMRIMRNLGPVKYWFRTHMMMGVLGPVSIIYHCNYQLGSLNSNVALFCMLLVASSGLVGRYFYTKIHYGLYGGKANLKELRQDSLLTKGQLESATAYVPELPASLEKFEAYAVSPAKSLVASLFSIVIMNIWSRWSQARLVGMLRTGIRREANNSGWSRVEQKKKFNEARAYLIDYFATVRRVVEFRFYDRLFSWWHVLHFPLFLMMIFSGIVHVIAVHIY